MSFPKKPFVCDCGDPAFRKKRNEPICRRCDSIEQQYGMRERKPPGRVKRRGRDVVHAPPKEPVSRYEQFDTEPLLLPDALRRLDEKIRSVLTPARQGV